MKTKIKNITNIQTGYFAKPLGEGDVVYLQVKHFDEKGRLQSSLHGDLLSDYVSDKHLLKSGDVLFAAKGNKNFASVYENQNPKAVASTSFFVLTITDDNIIPEYLAWFLNQPITQNIIKENAIGTAMPSIRKSVLEDLEISFPLIEKQRIIVHLTALIKKENELQLSIIKQRKQIIEQKMFQVIN